mgnify:CR=1 FL=1
MYTNQFNNNGNKIEPRVEEVSEFFNSGFTLGKRISTGDNRNNRINRPRVDKIYENSINNDTNINATQGIVCSPVNLTDNDSMYISQKHQQPSLYNKKNSLNDDDNNKYSSGDDYTPTIHKYATTSPQETHNGAYNSAVHNCNYNDGAITMDMEEDNSSNNNETGRQDAHILLRYKKQQVARRRRRENVSLFSKPWEAYPSSQERQKNGEKIIKDGFKKRRMLL